MTHTTIDTNSNYDIFQSGSKHIGFLFVLFLSIASLTVFQDFLESQRIGYTFYLSESILFKIIWILFIPLLAVLGGVLKKQKLDSIYKAGFYIIGSIVIHLFFLLLFFVVCSIAFYQGRYDVYKILNYTLANDLYTLVVIYSVFVLAHVYFINKSVEVITLQKESYLPKIIIGEGKNNTVVDVKDIYQISAETPYVSIQLEEKKFLHTETLRSLSMKLDTRTFVRVHKSTIVNLEKVSSFKSRLNGDYDLLLKNGTIVRLSRTYAANFKNEFTGTHRVKV
ncbi:LytR/AlgR family response regulator transcription factor [Imtechella halotolerans]|uniref:Response regulator receiver protein n=1 Tax=Imtechella halotolerans K1 TaxID=946077 RepID=I0WFY6_9FLAO|nr:LytTR family DNA-binding domain-containing protein [Imtechella halotolerans]EID75302.1 response regulator receiver protein [Imtechella halotolerans K1]WMQ63937.1 LytTR family DNA-binding domain-containing protein [Imtechella halotolerans]